MRSILWLMLLAVPAFATPLDRPKLERLLGLGHSISSPEGGEAPPSPLPWRLLGTLRSRDGASLAAVDWVSRSVTLQVGDVRDGVEVVAIEQQSLVVRRLGRLERIGSRPGVAAPLAVGRAISRQTVEHAIANPAQLMTDIQMMPAMVDGKLIGFRARWVKEGSLVASLGLKAGDTITRVNGTPLDSPQALLSLLQTLSSTHRYEVEVEREGQRRVESVQLDR